MWRWRRMAKMLNRKDNLRRFAEHWRRATDVKFDRIRKNSGYETLSGDGVIKE